MEEWVGQKWHHFITQKSSFHYPQSGVKLAELKKPLAIFFRALGGDAGISLGHTSAQVHHGNRNWVQKMSGTGKKRELAHFSSGYFYLPEQIDCFAEKALNQDLYYWLAAIASFNQAPNQKHPLEHNHFLTQQALKLWPGLATTYHRLVQAHIKQRPHINTLPIPVQKAEQLIQQIIQEPWQSIHYDYDPSQMPQPVVFWLKAWSQDHLPVKQPTTKQPESSPSQQSKDGKQKNKRYQTEQTDAEDDKDGFMSFRLESMFSWSEFINIDRSEDDGEDEDAFRVADDLDQLSINQGETGHKIRLDLDLPSREYDDELLVEGILMPEWDYKKNQYLNNHCSLQLMALKLTETARWPASLKQQAHRLKRQFEALKPISTWHNRQIIGDEIDLNAYLDFNTDCRMNQHRSESLLYRQRHNHNRDLSTLILTDLSLSTDAHVNDEKKVIDVIKEALYLLAESLNAAHERFAIAGFTSKKRSHVRYYQIKDFDKNFDDNCQDQIHAIKPAYYTRMGTAIRYATQQLLGQKTQQKLLLILTDGKPNDLDKYESRYGLEDTKKAISEAKNKGLTPFCVSIDYMASDYLPYLFGNQGFIHLNNALDLPKKLPKLFFQLVN